MQTNKINMLFTNKSSKIISIYFTAGYPDISSTIDIILSLQENGVDMIEVGIPFSDSLADGYIIQEANAKALANGMNLGLLFDQLLSVKERVYIPLILMGYLNPILQYGIEKFCQHAKRAGVSGIIIPDITLEEYVWNFKNIFRKYSLPFILLIDPNTSVERIKKIDKYSNGFIYAVSSSSTTGNELSFSDSQRNYLKQIANLNLKNPVLVGFGIQNAQTLHTVTQYCHGAIIGSAFIKRISNCHKLDLCIKNFFKEFKLNSTKKCY